LVEFIAWRSVNSSLAVGIYSEHNFYAEVLNLLNMSADLVCPALNNVLLVSTGRGTAGLGLGLGFGHVGLGLGPAGLGIGLGLSTVGLGLGLGLGRPGLDNITVPRYHGPVRSRTRDCVLLWPNRETKNKDEKCGTRATTAFQSLVADDAANKSANRIADAIRSGALDCFVFDIASLRTGYLCASIRYFRFTFVSSFVISSFIICCSRFDFYDIIRSLRCLAGKTCRKKINDVFVL
jgi:hypothetical protein